MFYFYFVIDGRVAIEAAAFWRNGPGRPPSPLSVSPNIYRLNLNSFLSLYAAPNFAVGARRKRIEDKIVLNFCVIFSKASHF